MVFCSREVLQPQPQYNCINLHMSICIWYFSCIFRIVLNWLLVEYSDIHRTRVHECENLQSCCFFSLSWPYACSFLTSTQCLLRILTIANSNKNGPIRLIVHAIIFHFWTKSFSVSTICHTFRLPHMNRKIEIFIENQNKSTWNERVRHLFWILFLAT